MRTRFTVLLLLGAFALAPGLAAAADPSQSVEQMIETAKTPADHKAIADRYREEAAQAKAQAQEHDKMARTYKPPQEMKMNWGTVQQRQQMADHCKRISQQSAANAEDFEALAKLHDDVAKTAK